MYKRQAIYRDEQGNIISRKSPVYGSGKRTEAQKRANRKYYALHYKTIGGKIPLEHLPEIEQYALKNGLTISRLVVKSITYCMENRIELSNPKKMSIHQKKEIKTLDKILWIWYNDSGEINSPN